MRSVNAHGTEPPMTRLVRPYYILVPMVLATAGAALAGTALIAIALLAVCLTLLVVALDVALRDRRDAGGRR